MLTTDRECQRGGERFAIPTLGEIEGKLIVSEVVAICCLRQLLVEHGAQALPAIKRRVKRKLQGHCKDASLCVEDTGSAVEYALQLLDAAAATVGKPGSRDADRRPSAMGSGHYALS